MRCSPPRMTGVLSRLRPRTGSVLTYGLPLLRISPTRLVTGGLRALPPPADGDALCGVHAGGVPVPASCAPEHRLALAVSRCAALGIVAGLRRVRCLDLLDPTGGMLFQQAPAVRGDLPVRPGFLPYLAAWVLDGACSAAGRAPHVPVLGPDRVEPRLLFHQQVPHEPRMPTMPHRADLLGSSGLKPVTRHQQRCTSHPRQTRPLTRTEQTGSAAPPCEHRGFRQLEPR